MSHARTLLALALLLAFAAQRGEARAPAQAVGSIGGTVTSNTGTPLSMATVVATNIADPSVSRTEYTDGVGCYRITQLAPGTYFMSFSARGFRSSEVSGVVVSAGQTSMKDKQLFAARLTALYGTVKDATGAGVPGATVRVSEVVRSSVAATRSATTDQTGQYAVMELPEGIYNVEVESSGFARAEVKNVELRSEGSLPEVNIVDVVLSPGDISKQVTVSSAATEVRQRRPLVTRPADFQPRGVLQLESGYDAGFRAERLRLRQSAPITLSLAATNRLLFEARIDAATSATDEATRRRETGFGDARLGFQVLALRENRARPALGLSYRVKLPAADERRGLGTGRLDHDFGLLLTKHFGRESQYVLNFNSALLAVGRARGEGLVTGGQVSLSLSRQYSSRWGVAGELLTQSKDDLLPRGGYAAGAVVYRFNRRFSLDGGLRFGLNDAAPHVGVFFGATLGLAKIFR